MKKVSLLLSMVTFAFVGVMAALPAQALIINNPIIERSDVQPGTTIHETTTIINEFDVEKTFSISILDFTVDENNPGMPIFLPEGQNAEFGSIREWISPIGNITLKPKESQEVGIDISVPLNAEPGDHYGGVLFQDIGLQENLDDVVGVKAKTGPLIIIGVAGDIKKDSKLLSFGTLPEKKWLWNRPPVDFFARVQNNGTVHDLPTGMIAIHGWYPKNVTVEFNESTSRVMPHSSRQLTAKWDAQSVIPGFWAEFVNEFRNFAIGPQKATLALKHSTGGVEFATVIFWIIPWHLLLAVIVFLIVLYFAIRQYNRSVGKRYLKKQQANAASKPIEKKE